MSQQKAGDSLHLLCPVRVFAWNSLNSRQYIYGLKGQCENYVLLKKVPRIHLKYEGVSHK